MHELYLTVSGSPMQTASGTVMTALVTSSEKDQRPWVAAKAAGGVINSSRMPFTGPNGKDKIIHRTI